MNKFTKRELIILIVMSPLLIPATIILTITNWLMGEEEDD